MAEPHRFPLRVYYEDTDFSGVVYHASYLRFLERGRTEFLRAAGVNHSALHAADPPLALAVRRLTIAFERPALMDDWLIVETMADTVSRASVRLMQRILRGAGAEAVVLVEADVQVVAIARGRAVRLPEELSRAMVDL